MDTLLSLSLVEDDSPQEGESKFSNVVCMAPDNEFRVQQAVQRLKLRRLAAKGVNAKQAAEGLGLHMNTVRSVYRDPQFKQEVMAAVNGAFEDIDDEIVARQRSLEEEMEALAWDAFSILKDKLTSGDAKLTDYQRAKLAEGVLDRMQATAKYSKNIQVGTKLEADDLVRASQTAREMEHSLQQKLRRA